MPARSYMSYKLLAGKDVDVLEPFPEAYWPQATQWMYRHHTLVFGDQGPQTPEEIEVFLRTRSKQPGIRTWGIVDKNNLTQVRSTDIPLVGVVFWEQDSPYNGYIHLASNRRGWGPKLAQPSLVEQGAELIKQELWDSTPSLQRISTIMFAHNKAARTLANALGLVKDGYFKSMGCIKGKPIDMIHYGLLRKPELEGPQNVLGI